ncbi:endo-1,4-beta-xylanase [Tsukamurella pseudospumae]|uniref:endo-1,4-beta-xylanase n=1 Tax=Tsukamurella pseudospumae TaxID=239498 RepID=A0A137ZZY4_9ACTN|nr:endo-1,4-beta-xylanase [Tsukamurella pseudospumae]KXP03709.1 glycoside hydrolase [Tsukamurella pseudospumae]
MKRGRPCAILVGAAIAAACGTVEPGASPSNRAGPCDLAGPPPRDLAEGRTIGTAYRSVFADGDRCYAEIAGRDFGSLTTEIGTMTNTVAPTPGRFDFREADAVADAARRNHQDFQIHSLIWDPLDQQVWGIVPEYVRALPDAQRHRFMTDLVTKVVSRYAGRASTVTVVNEPFDQRGGLQHNAWWRSTSSDEYIVEAFRAARLAAPTMKLLLNEHSSETISDKSNALLALSKKLRDTTVEVNVDGKTERRPLLDGVGFQAHMLGGPDQQPRTEDMRANLKRFTDLGLDVRFTELDVRIPTKDGRAGAEDLQRQARVYATMAGLCRETARCTGITFWGFTDRHSWITDYPATFSGYGSANLLDADYRAKPAWDSLRSALR